MKKKKKVIKKKKITRKKREPKKELTIKKKFLENKSRKGWHYYIKEGSKRPAYYKIKEGVSIESYLLAYKGKIKIKKKGVVEYSKETPAQKYLRKVSKAKRIDDLISKGITESSIPNIAYLGKKRIHSAYVKMLSPLVKDKELLNILALEENVEKFKHRIQTSIKISSEDDTIEINLKAFTKTLPNIISDLQAITRKNNIMEEDLNNLLRKGYSMDGIPKGVNITGSQYHVLAKRLGKVRLRLRFVKGK